MQTPKVRLKPFIRQEDKGKKAQTRREAGRNNNPNMAKVQ